MLKLIPGIKLNLVERCSGHGGSFGIKKDTFETAMAVGKPVFAKVKREIEKNKGK
jgi:glycerol-3-phosphate dehydrogenase subunit C